MQGSQGGNALTISDRQGVVPISFQDQKAEENLRARLSRSGGQAVAVRIAPAESSDVQGHAADAALKSVWLRLQVEGDDTEGHAISVHFPTADEAERFRRGILAAGLLAGTIAIGSAGAIAVTSHPATPAVAAPVEQSQVYQRPAGHGLLRGADITDPAAISGIGAAAASPVTGIDPATGKPARSGFQQGADAGMTGPAASELPGSPALPRPAGSGPLEDADR